MPDEATRLRELTLRAVRARGVLTESGVAEHWRLRGGAARIRPTVDGLVGDGSLERVRVEDDGAGVLVSGRRGSRPSPPDRRARSCPRSTTCSGTGRSRAGCWASTT